jgi:hypothetical protein
LPETSFENVSALFYTDFAQTKSDENSLLLIPSHANSASSAAECQARSVAKVAAIHKIIHSCQDLQVKGFILHGCDKDKN